MQKKLKDSGWCDKNGLNESFHLKDVNKAVLMALSKILENFFPFRVSQPPCAGGPPERASHLNPDFLPPPPLVLVCPLWSDPLKRTSFLVHPITNVLNPCTKVQG